MVDVQNAGIVLTQFPQDKRKKPGPKPTSNRKVFVGARIPEDLVEYVKQWQDEGEAANLSEALECCLRDAKKWVARPGFARDRDAKGRWVKDERPG